MKIQVLNKHTLKEGERGEYIGRGSPLGNPWTITPDRPRQVCIDIYRSYLKRSLETEDPDILREMTRLHTLALQGPLNLVCFCAPAPCHGDVIREALLSCEAVDP